MKTQPLRFCGSKSTVRGRHTRASQAVIKSAARQLRRTGQAHTLTPQARLDPEAISSKPQVAVGYTD